MNNKLDRNVHSVFLHSAKRLIAIGLGLLLACLLMELVLRIYNPFQFRVRGNQIILPVNKRSVIPNEKITKLDPLITHTTNSLGFRGEDPPGMSAGKIAPAVFDQYLTIIAVGGSTTECYFLSDGDTWPEVLGELLKQSLPKVWVNNAGLVGHSTFGHLVLMRASIVDLHPDVVLFMTGANDVGITIPNQIFDQKIIQGGRFHADPDKADAKTEKQNAGLCFSSASCLVVSLAEYSEVANLGLNIYRSYKASQTIPGKANPSITVTGDIDEIQEDLTRYSHREIPNADEILAGVTPETNPPLGGYRQRILELIQVSRQNGIEPVLITQPALYGQGVDDVSGVNLETLEIEPKSNAYLKWKLLEKYNDVLRQASQDENVLVIDLARKMPKSSRYYYDFIHFTAEGAHKVAEIIKEDLVPFLQARSW